MTAVTLTKAEAALITRAQAVKSRAMNITWPDETRPVIRAALHGLLDALDMHDALVNGDLHWEVYDPDLRQYAEPYEVALQMAAEDADEAAGVLIEVIGKHIGDEAAAFVGGEEGERS